MLWTFRLVLSSQARGSYLLHTLLEHHTQAVFLTYGAMAPASAELAAELLGFDPKLVLPQLEKARAGAAVSQGAVAPPA